jgi:hypothetical protein
MRKPTYQFLRNFRGELTMNAALSLVQDNRAASAFVRDALQSEYGPLKGTTKHVARAANSNARSAENWLQARVCPDVPKFLRLAMQVPELNAAVMWLMQNGPAHPKASRIIATMEQYMSTLPEPGDRI